MPALNKEPRPKGRGIGRKQAGVMTRFGARPATPRVFKLMKRLQNKNRKRTNSLFHGFIGRFDLSARKRVCEISISTRTVAVVVTLPGWVWRAGVFATLWAPCSFIASFRQVVPAGEPGFGGPVLSRTPEAFTGWRRCRSVHLLQVLRHPGFDVLLPHARASRPRSSGYFE